MPKMIAEVGCNHKGSFSIAAQMISTAAEFCLVDVVKFQKRDIETSLSPNQRAAPHPEPHHAYGATYGEHRNALEFDLEKHRRLKEICGAFGVVYSCSVWDVISARQIASLQPAMIKVPSAQNLNWRLLRTLMDEYGGEIHISLGMTTRSEEERLVDFVSKSGRGTDVVLYSCTSAYPVEDEDVCLLEIGRLRKAYGSIVKEIGFSGHHLGIAMDSAAVALGAEWIERHFTLNRAWKGTDHAASLEPEAMRQAACDVRSVSRAMRYKGENLLDVELAQRTKLKVLDGE